MQENQSTINPAPGPPLVMPNTRIEAIDILRALTMVLMIFVNDLGSLKGIPLWLEHVESGVDGIGLADVVFPAFMFIVGMSLPIAMERRWKNGESDQQIIFHILLRTLALIVMGVFLVNGETINADATGMRRYFWNPLCCLAFILIWNAYRPAANKNLVRVLRVTGIAILLILAFIYRGGKDDNIYRFGTHWWGILGLIGWSYLVCALITLFSKGRFLPLLISWIFFCVLSMVAKAFPEQMQIVSFIPGAIRGGTFPGLTMGGVLTIWIFRHYYKQHDNKSMFIIYALAVIGFVILSVLTRPYWKLAKLGATPAWLFLCSAFTLGAFMVIYWISDVKGKGSWFKIFKPAGTDTLLCYLMPYFLVFILYRVLQIKFPEFILTGGVGLLKTFLFAMLCVWLTKLLNQAGVKLKL